MTLVELLIVIIIIGLLSLIALPNFLGQTGKANDVQVKENLRTAIAQLNSMRVNENEDWSQWSDSGDLVTELNIEPDGNSYSAASLDEEVGLDASLSPNNVIVRYIDESTIHIYAKSNAPPINGHPKYYCAELAADDYVILSNGVDNPNDALSEYAPNGTGGGGNPVGGAPHYITCDDEVTLDNGW